MKRKKSMNHQPKIDIAKLVTLIVIAVVLHLSYRVAAGEQLKKVSFTTQWFPQAQFAGYYVALEKGFYKRHGIDLTIHKGGPDNPPMENLVKHKTDFVTLFLAEGITKRAEGIKLVNIAQIVQRSGFILVAKKSSGITKPEHMNGKKVSMWSDSQVQAKAFFRKYGLKIQPFVQTSTPNLFLRGVVDVSSAMWYNEYHTLLNSGINSEELTTFFFDQYGLNFPEDGIYCLEETCRKDPRLCRGFVQASLDGWLYTFEHPEESLNIVMKYVDEARINTSRAHQRWMLCRMKDIIAVGGNTGNLGRLKQEDYFRVAREIHEAGLIKTMPAYGDFYVPLSGTK